MVMVTRYMIRYTPNFGRRTMFAKEFKTMSEAKKEIRRLLAKPIFNVPGDKRTRRTALRDTLPNGLNNPRIIKRRVNR